MGETLRSPEIGPRRHADCSKKHALKEHQFGRAASVSSGTVPRKGPWLRSQTHPSLSPLFRFPAQGPLASYLASSSFCFLICELGRQPTAKHCRETGGAPVPALARRGPCHVVLLLPHWTCRTCQRRELSFGMRTHRTLFIIPASWGAGDRREPLWGKDINGSSQPEVPHHL